MDTVLVVVLAVVLGLALLVLVSFLLSRVVLRKNAKRAGQALPPAGPRDYEDSAIGLTAPFKAYGLLRLTPAQLLFANGTSGDVLTISRTAIVASVASEDVPTGSGMQTLRRTALVLQLDDPRLPQGLGFMVTDPEAWVGRLRG